MKCINAKSLPHLWRGWKMGHAWYWVGCPVQCPSGACLSEGVAVELVFQLALHYLFFFLHWCSVSLKVYLQTSADPGKLQ